MSLEAEIQHAIAAAKMQSFVAAEIAYLAREPAEPLRNRLVPLSLVLPPPRNSGVAGINPDRALAVLRAISSGEPLPPVEVDEPPDIQTPYRYRVRDGFHRFHLSAALGFSHLPVVIKPYFNWIEL